MSQTIEDLNPANQIIYSPSNLVQNVRNWITKFSLPKSRFTQYK